jgi:hypothetical protein
MGGGAIGTQGAGEEPGSWELEFAPFEFVLSHPFRDETAERMGHGRSIFEPSES